MMLMTWLLILVPSGELLPVLLMGAWLLLELLLLVRVFCKIPVNQKDVKTNCVHVRVKKEKETQRFFQLLKNTNTVISVKNVRHRKKIVEKRRKLKKTGLVKNGPQFRKLPK
jgi:hypothetical protein